MSDTDTLTGIAAFGSTAEERRAHDAELLEAASFLLVEQSPMMRFTGVGYVIVALAALHRTFRAADEEASMTQMSAMRALCAVLRPFFTLIGALLRFALGEPQNISVTLRERHENAIRVSVGAPIPLHDPALANTSLVDVRIAVSLQGTHTEIVFSPSDDGTVLRLHGKNYGISVLRGEGEAIAITHRSEPVADVLRVEQEMEFRGDTGSVMVQDGALLGAITELLHGASGVMLEPQYTSIAGATTQTVRFALLLE